MAQPITSPYFEGNILTLRIQRPGSKQNALPPQLASSGIGDKLQAKIVSVMEPSTMSVVVEVELLPDPSQGEQTAPSRMVLKAYDRQLAPELRDFKGKSGLATRETEEEYKAFLRRPGAMSQFLAAYDDHGAWAYAAEDWDTPRREAYFHAASARSHGVELQVYDRLVALQGVHVPTLFADVRLGPQQQQQEEEEEGKGGLLAEYTEIRAILIEYIPGFSLNDLVTETPKSDWAGICDQAIGAVQKIIDHDFVNYDFAPRNALVVRRGGSGHGGDVGEEEADGSAAPSPYSYQVFYIDFGQCAFRDASVTDEEWRETKRQRDEEGAIGCLLAHRVEFPNGKPKGKKAKKCRAPLPLAWTYTPSDRFQGEYIELYDTVESEEATKD
ncbi:uncharacterized protein PG998_002823 [Apiospora kogelbergensis]|uniref:uncharacterized protein n=1 Tax=Apiospora kogelbergensis TaxID=1337665 RepID=UPI00312E5576